MLTNYRELPNRDRDKLSKKTSEKMKVYLESDDEIINLEAKIKYLDQMLYWLDQVMKQISNRGFQIKSAIEWEKFVNGQ